MRRAALLLVPAMTVSVLAVGPAPPARAELPTCLPWVPRPVEDGRRVKGRHSVFCNKEMISITIIGTLTRTYDDGASFVIARKRRTCIGADKCTVRTRGRIYARRSQSFHAWVSGVAIYQCKPEEVRYCTRQERRRRERKRIRVTKTRSQCLHVGGSRAAMRPAINEQRAGGGDTARPDLTSQSCAS